MAKFCTPTWLARSVQEGPRRFLKYKAKGPPHSFTLSLLHSTLRKDLGLIFMRRKGQHSTIPSVLSLYIACVRSSPVHFPRKAALLYTFPSQNTKDTLGQFFIPLLNAYFEDFVSVFSPRFLHESSFFWSLVYVDNLFVPFGDHLIGQKLFRTRKGHSGR